MTIGIDLGTTNSVAAFVDEGVVRLIPNGRGQLMTPSILGLDSAGSVIVGEAARNQAVTSPERTILQVKRSMGKRTTLRLGDNRLSPEEVSAMILRSLRSGAGAYLGEEPRRAVITVPAHFDDHQRFATLEAALLGGFRYVELLNEPTAAALPYATRDGAQERIVVFDFGGGTLDITCLERAGRDFAVCATAGDGQLGGVDIDRRLSEIILEELRAQVGPLGNDEERMRRVCLELAERGKIDLSEVSATEISVPFLASSNGSTHFGMTLTRDHLAAVSKDLLQRAVKLTGRAIEEAGFDRKGFDRIVLAGGSSRIPGVRAMLEAEFDVPTAHRVNPEEAIATGAALFAANMDRDSDRFTLRDVISGTLAIELADGSCVPLVRKNQTLPVEHSRLFTTVNDNQTEAEIHLVQGNHSQAWRNRSLGRFVLRDIREAPQGGPRIAVTIAVSGDGIVTVRAGDRDSGARGEMVTRARPEPTAQAIIGDRDGFGRSLVRRARALRSLASEDLREELDEVLSIIEVEGGYHRSGEDMLTVLETLLREIVYATTAPLTGEPHHAAS
jgi:molecular chaperone DnaK